MLVINDYIVSLIKCIVKIETLMDDLIAKQDLGLTSAETEELAVKLYMLLYNLQTTVDTMMQDYSSIQEDSDLVDTSTYIIDENKSYREGTD